MQRDSGNTSVQYIALSSDFETINSIPFAGKAVTFSFYARAGANFSAASNALSVSVVTGTGTDQSLSSGYTGQTTAISGTATLTTTWQRFTFTGTIGSTATQIGLQPYYTPVGTAGANDYFEITGVQLELGSTATSFATYATTYQGELAACQRYYQRTTVGVAYSILSLYGTANSTSSISTPFNNKVSMRVAPTSVDYSNILASKDGVSSSLTVSAVILVAQSTFDNINLGSTVVGAVATVPYALYANNTSGYIGVSAEL